MATPVLAYCLVGWLALYSRLVVSVFHAPKGMGAGWETESRGRSEWQQQSRCKAKKRWPRPFYQREMPASQWSAQTRPYDLNLRAAKLKRWQSFLIIILFFHSIWYVWCLHSQPLFVWSVLVAASVQNTLAKLLGLSARGLMRWSASSGTWPAAKAASCCNVSWKDCFLVITRVRGEGNSGYCTVFARIVTRISLSQKRV